MQNIPFLFLMRRTAKRLLTKKLFTFNQAWLNISFKLFFFTFELKASMVLKINDAISYIIKFYVLTLIFAHIATIFFGNIIFHYNLDVWNTEKNDTFWKVIVSDFLYIINTMLSRHTCLKEGKLYTNYISFTTFKKSFFVFTEIKSS